MSSFGPATFLVIGSEGRFPLPFRDADGTTRYRAEVRCASAAAYAALADQRCHVTVKRAVGSFALALQVDAGPGAATLTVPTRAGVSQDFTAVLVGFEPTASGRTAEEYRAACEWVVTTDATP